MDLIDRDAAIKAVATELAFHSYAGNIAANAIKSVPSAEKRGKWTSSQGLAEVGECYCSVCKTVYYADDLYQIGETDENGTGQAWMPYYCPHCGAKMESEE